MLLDDLETDPKATVPRLEAIHQRHHADRNYTRTLAEAVASGAPELERAGAWLLRRQVADEGGLPAKDWAVVLDGLAGVTSWEARLELCQLLAGHPALTDVAAEDVAGFLRGCAADGNAFVRAWGVTAFHAFAARHTAHRAEARRLLAAARKDPAKSVQARLRHLVKAAERGLPRGTRSGNLPP